MKKLAIWFASLSLLGLCAAGPALAANYALCTGINNYNQNYIENNNLNGCVPDARHMTNLIVSRGEWSAANVSILTDSGATLTSIRQGISNYAAKAKSGDKFLYYHSSHGGNDVYYFEKSNGDYYLHYGLDSTGVSNYICCYNTNYTAKMMATDLAAFPSGVEIVVMMDTCHSAGMFKYNATTSSKKALAAKLAAAKAEGTEGESQTGVSAPENSAAGFFMAAVMEQLEQVEAEQVRRGLRPRGAKSVASNVGWIAAADYDQYSLDAGTSGGAFTVAFINGVTNQNKMCDNATYGNQDGYASFYEGWNYAKDIARGARDEDEWYWYSQGGYYDYNWADPQCANTNVLKSVLIGWAGKTAPANVAPTFPSATATTNGYVNGEIEYTFSASGNPTPTYTLSTSVSSSLYDFQNGYLVFQPAAAGTFTFTCTAANGVSPNATCVLTVTVTEPPPAIPEVPSTPPTASTTSFTATWSAVSDAASYNLYVEQKVAASSSARASRAASTILSESFESDIPSTWTKSSNVAVATDKDGDGDSCVAFKGSGAYLISEAVDNPTGVSLMYKRSGNTTAWGLDISVGPSVDGPWTSVGTISSADTTWNTYETTFTASGTVYLKFTDTRSTGAAERYVDLIQVTGDSATWTPVSGYYPVSVSGTSKAVSGLSSGTEYRYSVAAVNAAGVESEPSPYVTVETAEGASAPTISVPETSYSRTLGDGNDVDFTVTASGSPTPTLALSSATAAAADYDFDSADGYFTFTPSATGTFTFVFTASNSEGSDSATVTVTVSAAPVTVPVLMVDDTTDTTAYATWSECTGVTTYTLQLASDNQFTTGGGSGGEVTLFSNDGTDATSAPAGWTYNVSDKASAYLLMFSGHSVVSEAVDASACTDLSVSLYIRTYGGTSYPNLAIQYSTDNGSTWTDAGTVAGASSTMAQRTLALPAAAASSALRLRFAPTTTSSSVGVGIKTIVLTGTESASGGGSLISETSVSDDEYTFTGLTPYTVYYARVKGNAEWSNVEEFLTDEAVVTDSAPSWSATFPATGTVDVGQFYTLANVSSYVSGSPSPTITLSAPAGLQAELEDDTFTFGAEASGSYTFTFTAANGISPDATATLVVTAVGQAPELTASLGTSIAVTVGDPDVDFTVTATGAPAPTVTATCTEGAYFVFENNGFLFSPEAVGTYHFVFTATNSEGSDTETVTITVSAAPVTIPTLNVTDITDTTALATWTACDGVSSYTLQLSTNDFPAASGASRSATPILSEDFSGFSGNGTADIGDSLDGRTAITGWTGSKVYTASETAKVGASSGQGWLMTPALDASGTLTVVWSAYRYGTSDKDTLFLGVSENGTDFDEETITLGDEMAGYTNTFTVSGPTVYVRWMASGSSKARFYLDDVRITNPGGGDTPSGDDIQEFTVPGTSYEFTGLSPYTVYYARVKGASYWSNTEEFLTDEAAPVGTAPSIDAIADRTMALEDIADEFTVTATGTPAPAFSVTSSDAPVGSFTIGENSGEFSFMPETVGTFHFTVTAANGVSPDATATFAVTVTGTAPALAAIADRTISLEDGGDEFTVTATGTPAPTFSVTSTDAPAGDYSIGEANGVFTFLAYSAGTYHFTITAANGVAPSASQSFTITVTATPEPPTSDFEQWLADHGASGHTADETAPNGHTYGQNYAADIDPTSADFLDLVVSDASTGQFTILNSSANRYYQLLYTTDLTLPLESYETLDLGQGATSGTCPATDAWYGGLRVTPTAP